MQLNSIMTLDNVFVGLKVNSKKQALQEITRRMTAHLEGLNPRIVLDQLMERERLGCTGIGDGIAIPHARCSSPEISTPLACLATLDKPIDYQAHDDKPVDIIFTLIAPQNVGGGHLTALALASRILRDKKRAEQLRKCQKPDAAWSILIAEKISSAA